MYFAKIINGFIKLGNLNIFQKYLPRFDTSFEVPRPETWTGFQTSGALWPVFSLLARLPGDQQ